MLLCIAHGPTQYIFHMPMTRYSIFLLKVSLNTGKTNVLVGRQEGHPACKKVGCWFVGCVTIWLELCTSYSSSFHHSPPPSTFFFIAVTTLSCALTASERWFPSSSILGGMKCLFNDVSSHCTSPLHILAIFSLDDLCISVLPLSRAIDVWQSVRFHPADVSNHQPCSNKIQKVACWYQLIWVFLENGR